MHYPKEATTGERQRHSFFQAHRLLSCRDPWQKAPRRAVCRALPVAGQVCGSPEDVAGSGQPVSPRSPHLLVVGFHLLGSPVVDDQPDICLVDAHPKGHRGHHALQNRSHGPPGQPKGHLVGICCHRHKTQPESQQLQAYSAELGQSTAIGL